jgi:hypothetical protein
MKVYQSKSGVELTLTDDEAICYAKVSNITFVRDIEDSPQEQKKSRVTQVLQDSEKVSE